MLTSVYRYLRLSEVLKAIVLNIFQGQQKQSG